MYPIPIQYSAQSKSTATFGRSNSKSKSKSRYKKFMDNDKCITFESLVKVILNFQLEQHSKMIQPINKNFKEIDGNLDGVINRNQLVKLIEKFYIIDEDVVDYIISQLDPNCINYITYSQFLKFSFNVQIPVNRFDESGKQMHMSLVDITDMLSETNGNH